MSESSSSSPLFTPPASPRVKEDEAEISTLEGPAIPGLYYLIDFFSSEEADRIIEEIIMQGYFDVEQGRDQAVIFGSRGSAQESGLPQWTQNFLTLVASRLREKGSVPFYVFELLFPRTEDGKSSEEGLSYTRQLILNCYQPGQGIASHIDLPHKFLDGIMIFSFGSSIAMTFENALNGTAKHSVYLSSCSLCVLSGESRWHWSHGIPEREGDYVLNANKDGKRYIKRGQRLSITVRWYRIQDDDSTPDLTNGLNQSNGDSGRESSDTGKTAGDGSDARLTASCNG